MFYLPMGLRYLRMLSNLLLLKHASPIYAVALRVDRLDSPHAIPSLSRVTSHYRTVISYEIFNARLSPPTNAIPYSTLAPSDRPVRQWKRTQLLGLSRSNGLEHAFYCCPGAERSTLGCSNEHGLIYLPFHFGGLNSLNLLFFYCAQIVSYGVPPFEFIVGRGDAYGYGEFRAPGGWYLIQGVTWADPYAPPWHVL